MENPPAQKNNGKTTRLLIVLVIILSALLVIWYFKFRNVIYNYTFTLPNSSKTENILEYGATPKLANADYYNEVREKFISDKINFVDADLSNMTLRVYDNGELQKEVKILTKGKEGSWWETPAGIYKIQTKESNHFSSFGKVYQPWSMVFQGNFFIHGWPYHSDGTPVASTYSGGCIRLSTEDAKAVYDLVKTGTPVVVYEKDFASDGFSYSPQKPDVKAEDYLVADLKSNSILASNGTYEKVSISSITELMTALVGAEYINLDKSTTITKDMIVETEKPRLKIGESITVYNLLFPLLAESSNESAEAMARTLGKTRFIALMNEKAGAINMKNTAFTDPSGTGAGDVSTAEDLFNLAKYISNNRSFIWNIASGKIKSSIYGDVPYPDLKNYNKVPDVEEESLGGKFGKGNEAEETYMGVFNITIDGEKRPIVFIVLRSPDAKSDVKNMIEYVKKTYANN